MVVYSSKTIPLKAEVLEVNIHRKTEIENILGCFFGFQVAGDEEKEVPTLFWNDGWLVCSCRTDGGITEVEFEVDARSNRSPMNPFNRPQKVKRDGYVFVFPVLCACLYEHYTKTIQIPTFSQYNTSKSPELRVPLVKVGSKFLQNVFKMAIEDAVKRLDEGSE